MNRALPRNRNSVKRIADHYRLVEVFALCFCLRTFLLLTARMTLLEGVANDSCLMQGPCSQSVDFIQVGVIVTSNRDTRHPKIMAKAAARMFRNLHVCGACWGINFSYRLWVVEDRPGETLTPLIQLMDLPTNSSNTTRAFIGPSVERMCPEAGIMAGFQGKALFTYGCRSQEMSNIKRFPTVVRTTGTFTELVRFLFAIIHRYFAFFEVVVVYCREAGWAEAVEEYDTQERRVWTTYLEINFKHDDIVRRIKRNMNSSQVFMFLMSPSKTWRLLKIVSDNGYFRGGFVFITVDYMNLGERLKDEHSSYDFTGLLDVTIAVRPHEPKFKTFVQDVVGSGNDSCLNYEFAIEAALMSDAISMMADSFAKHNECISYHDSGRCLVKEMRQASKEASSHLFRNQGNLTRDIIFTDVLTRYPNFMLNNLINDCYVPIAWSMYIENYPHVQIEQTSKNIVWPGGMNIMPVCTRGPCTFLLPEDNGAVATGIVVGATLVIVLALCVIAIRRRSTLHEMGRRDWIIPSFKLFAGQALSKASSVSVTRFKSKTKSVPHLASTRDSIRNMVTGQLYAKVSLMDQQLVAIKHVNKAAVEPTVAIIKEVTEIQHLKHGNVNRLVGACIDAGNVCLVWGYCVKGSLKDVLLNTAIRLDWMFKLSFINDIAKGMAYLHSSPVGVHGRLKSSNVVVDVNWSCKLTDIYLSAFRQGEDRFPKECDFNVFYDVLWTAPELLRLPRLLNGTKKGDVYSFAITMHEIITRGEPFGLKIDEDPQDLVERVMNEENPPFRPPMPEVGVADNFTSMSNEGVLDIMGMCWDEYPLFRLNFNVISQNLRKIRAAYGSGGNLVDQMLEVVMKYANNLEELVEERTEQLAQEQQRSEELINRMLPKSVAFELKMGNQVIPESYQSVTIFFSDIVGFTALAASSTPMQVVNLLNDLYTMFDNCVDRYDAYKIETIGDAYMVVSGLPVRNGDQHAGEIATAALDILTNVLRFKIPHLPDRQLYLRIGIHSGPVVAGVVGMKMPRYCLFGDTVNYAAKMESNGTPLHVHVSPECKEYLDKLGGYRLESRGPIPIMGKGTIETYYLRGKEGFCEKTQTLLPGVEKRVGIDVF